MLRINIIISKNEITKQEKIADVFDNDLNLTFQNEDEYLEFIKNPKLTPEDFNIIENITEVNKISEILKMQNLYEQIKIAKPTIKINNINELPIKILKSKKSISLILTSIDFKEVIEIITNPYIHNNVTFYGKYNEGCEMSLQEIIKVYEKLLTYTNKIIEKNYSPAESLFYIYNLIKKRIYQEEEKGEKLSTSRSITEVLNGDKIVCKGYSNLYAALANMLDLPVEICSWDSIYDDMNGHASIIVYLNDPKYNLCGIYGIDPTWDSKKNINDTEYENNIRHFLVPMKIEEQNKKNNGFKPSFGCLYYKFFISKIFYTRNPFFIYYKEKTYQTAEKIYKYLNLSEPIELNTTTKTLQKLSNEYIPIDVLKNIITTVTPKSDEDLEKTIHTSVHKNAYNQLLNRIINAKN